jgi:hypothetical protein
MYTSDFRRLSCDISWDEAAFMNQFQYGLCSNVKDLLFTMPNPSTLSETIGWMQGWMTHFWTKMTNCFWVPFIQIHMMINIFLDLLMELGSKLTTLVWKELCGYLLIKNHLQEVMDFWSSKNMDWWFN